MNLEASPENDQKADEVFEAESRDPEIIRSAIKEYAEEALRNGVRAEEFDIEVTIGQTDQSSILSEGLKHGNDNNDYPPNHFSLDLYKKGERGAEGLIDGRVYWFNKKLGDVSADQIRRDVEAMMEVGK